MSATHTSTIIARPPIAAAHQPQPPQQLTPDVYVVTIISAAQSKLLLGLTKDKPAPQTVLTALTQSLANKSVSAAGAASIRSYLQTPQCATVIAAAISIATKSVAYLKSLPPASIAATLASKTPSAAPRATPKTPPSVVSPPHPRPIPGLQAPAPKVTGRVIGVKRIVNKAAVPQAEAPPSSSLSPWDYAAAAGAAAAIFARMTPDTLSTADPGWTTFLGQILVGIVAPESEIAEIAIEAAPDLVEYFLSLPNPMDIQNMKDSLPPGALDWLVQPEPTTPVIDVPTPVDEPTTRTSGVGQDSAPGGGDDPSTGSGGDEEDGGGGGGGRKPGQDLQATHEVN